MKRKSENAVYAGTKAAMDVENMIMKGIAEILCEQHLITKDEKSRLILLIDKRCE